MLRFRLIVEVCGISDEPPFIEYRRYLESKLGPPYLSFPYGRFIKLRWEVTYECGEKMKEIVQHIATIPVPNDVTSVQYNCGKQILDPQLLYYDTVLDVKLCQMPD